MQLILKNKKLTLLNPDSEHIKKVFTLKELPKLYKNNNGNVVILNEEEVDITKVLLLKLLCDNVNNEELYWNYFSSLVEDDELESIIYAQSFNDWYTRRLRK